MPGFAMVSPDIPTTLSDIGAQVLVRGWLSSNNTVFRCPGGSAGGATGNATGGATDDAQGAETGGRSSPGACVVDTGYHSHAAQTVALVAQALGGQALARVVNTHLHADHCGGNAHLARHWPGLHTSVPIGYQTQLQPWDDSRLSYLEYDQHCEPFTPQAFLQAGDLLRLGPRHWQVHAAPGHDPDAVLLFEPQSRTLISGDALWRDRLAIIFPELDGQPGFGAAHQALDMIEALAPQLVLPGHGEPFTEVAQALAASRQRLDAFAAAPIKHRQHAARALVSFHMLEHRARPHSALVDWIVNTPIFRRALQCENDEVLAHSLALQTLDRLVHDGVLARQGDVLVMHGR